MEKHLTMVLQVIFKYITRLTPLVWFPKQHISSWLCNRVYAIHRIQVANGKGIHICCWCKIVISEDSPVPLARPFYDSDEFVKHRYGVVGPFVVKFARYLFFYLKMATRL